MVKATLQKIWPKEGWSDLINDERTDDVLNQLDFVYAELREYPRESECGITSEQWEAAYENGLMILKALFRKSKTVDDVLAMNKRFSERLLINYSRIQELSLSDTYEYWALSKTSLSEIKQDAFDIQNLFDNGVIVKAGESFTNTLHKNNGRRKEK